MMEISNSQDIIDSREVIARIETLKSYRDALQDDVGDSNEKLASAALKGLAEWQQSEEGDELRVLEALALEGESSIDWLHGETLIHSDYFTEYAEQMACDIGAVSGTNSWPANCIDWDYAAEQLQQDYGTVDFDGVNQAD